MFLISVNAIFYNYAIMKHFFSTHPKIALTLSSGSARGWAHIGVIRALEENHIPIHLLTGCSAGGIIAAFYAANALNTIQEFAYQHNNLSKTIAYLDFTWKGGVFKGDKFVKFLYDKLPVHRFDELNPPLGLVATDLSYMKEVHLTSGYLIPALRASMAIPTAFAPIENQKRQLADGGILNPTPVNLARLMGADVVIAVDLDNTEEYKYIKSPLDGFSRALWTMSTRIMETNKRLYPADVTIKPKLDHFHFGDYHRAAEAIEIGYQATNHYLSEIKNKLSKGQFTANKHHLNQIPSWASRFHLDLPFTSEDPPKTTFQPQSGENKNILATLTQLVPPHLLQSFSSIGDFRQATRKITNYSKGLASQIARAPKKIKRRSY